MNEITVDINVGDLKRALFFADRDVRNIALVKSVDAGARVIQANAMINVEKTFSRHSIGILAESITVETKTDSSREAWANIGSTLIYARIHELGGVIKPIFAKLLHWIDRETGEHVFAKVVHMPARPYLRPAVEENKKEIGQAMGYQIIQVLKNRPTIS